MTTNDPSTTYGLHREGREPKEPAKREPMFERFEAITEGGMYKDPEGGWVRYDDIADKIASEELIVRNKCKKCGNLWTPTFITKDRCPGCGQPIA